jgi:hypothetical protein
VLASLMARKVVGVLLTMLVAWIGLTPSPGHGATLTASAAQIYAYTIAPVGVSADAAPSERGRRTHGHRQTAHDAVDNLSHGVLARPEATAAYGYDHRAQPMQIDSTGTTTREPVRGSDGVVPCRREPVLPQRPVQVGCHATRWVGSPPAREASRQ